MMLSDSQKLIPWKILLISKVAVDSNLAVLSSSVGYTLWMNTASLFNWHCSYAKGRQPLVCMLRMAHILLGTQGQITTQATEALVALLRLPVWRKSSASHHFPDLPRASPWEAGNATGAWLAPSESGQAQPTHPPTFCLPASSLINIEFFSTCTKKVTVLWDSPLHGGWHLKDVLWDSHQTSCSERFTFLYLVNKWKLFWAHLSPLWTWQWEPERIL